MKNLGKFLGDYIMPSYNELTLFSMAVVFAALLGANGDLRSVLFQILDFGEFNPEAFMYLLIFVVMLAGGFSLSLYHVFTSRRKDMVEKSMMLTFAGITNGIAGIIAGVHIIDESDGLWLTFPVINIISSMALLYLLALSDERKVKDEDTTLLQVVIVTSTCMAIFILCQFVWDLYWAITFSICVFYATSVGEVITKLLRLGGGKHQPLLIRPQEEIPITEVLLHKGFDLIYKIQIKLGKRKPEDPDKRE